MPDYRRAKTTGGTYFFTLVTNKRKPIFKYPECRDVLRSIIVDVQIEYPFDIDAWVLMPDHIHAIWTMPPDSDDYSKRWGLIKARFTKYFRQTNSALSSSVDSLWQKRFWEHEIRDQNDLNNHLDYLHYNPVKHGYVTRVRDWPFSSFHKYARRGYYAFDWGDDVYLDIDAQFGE